MLLPHGVRDTNPNATLTPPNTESWILPAGLFFSSLRSDFHDTYIEYISRGSTQCNTSLTLSWRSIFQDPDLRHARDPHRRRCVNAHTSLHPLYQTRPLMCGPGADSECNDWGTVWKAAFQFAVGCVEVHHQRCAERNKGTSPSKFRSPLLRSIHGPRCVLLYIPP